MKYCTVIFLLVTIVRNVQLQNIPKSLPESVKPFFYNITLEPDLNSGELKGTAEIGILVEANTTNITIHARSLDITIAHVVVVNSTGHKVNVTNVNTDNSNDFIIINFGNTLIQGQRYNLSITNYTGSLKQKDNIGFYLMKNYDEYGSDRRIALTQFQALGARRAFPCFDEPHLKSKFYINIIRPNGYKSISNEILQNTRNLGNDRFCDEFKETLNMSTYSTAFAVTNYESTVTKKGQRIFVDLRLPNMHAYLQLNEGIELLEKLENFIGVKYSLSKIDSIALPAEQVIQRDIQSWGMLSYRNSNLNYTRDTLTNFEKQTDILKMSEAYSQQWFGNLVSPFRWNYIWLNEGFRNYFKYIGANLMGWEVMEQFNLHCVQNALALDSAITSKPLNFENIVINRETNATIYHKAGAIIRMLQHIMTMEIFQKSVRLYLQDNAFNAVKPLHLYQAFQRIVDIENHHGLLGNHTVFNILKSWDSQAGYPVVFVQRQYSINSLTVTQSRFLMEPNESIIENPWYIPLTYVVEGYGDKNFSSTVADVWMAEKSISINGVTSLGWIIFNKQQSGFYRVNYDYENWNRIITHLCKRNISSIHVLNKAQLLDDAFNLAHAGLLNFTTPLNLSRYIQREISYIPISAFLMNAMLLHKKLSEENGHDNLHLLIGDVLNGEAINYLTNEERINDTQLEKLNRVQILTALCTVGNLKCRNYALNTFRLWIKDPDNHIIVPNLEPVIFCGAMHIGNQKDWDLLYEKYKTTKNVLRKRRILNALGCTKNNDTLKGFLKKVFGANSDMNHNDKLAGFKSVYMDKFRISFVFNYIVEHFDEIYNAFPDDIPQILIDLAEKLTTKEQLSQLEALSNKYPWLQDTFVEPLKIVKSNIEFNSKFGSTIKTWLIGYVANRKSGCKTVELSGMLKFVTLGWFIITLNKYLI